MNEASSKIRIMRDQQLARSMRAVAIIGFFALMISLSRTFTMGWHNIMYLHIALYLVVVGTVFWGRGLSFSIRAGIMVLACFILGVAALITWGLAASGLLALFCFCLLSTNLFGARAGIIASIISIVTIALIGAFVQAGILSFRFNADVYLHSVTTWLIAIIAMALSAGIIIIALGALNRQIEELVCALEKQNEELLEKNRLLENEIEGRIRAEEARRTLEGRLQVAKKMESIGKLAGGVAHDLNNTLGSIVAYPDLLLDELPKGSHLRDTIKAIKQSGVKAATIVNDMLTLARSGIVTAEAINLNSVISEYCSSPEFKQLMSFHHGIVVEVHLENEPLNVRGSFFHLSKIMMNLVSNAAEAMPDGGNITISTEKQKVDRQAGMHEEINAGEYAVLCVADTGIGIPQEDMGRIFEPFFTKKTMGRSGTGLGMAVVWGSVKDHNGHITVESVEGKGTKFTVYLPLTKEPLAVRKSLHFPKAPLGRGESILVIDDVKEQREIASRILTKMGYSVHTVGSGEEALEYLQSKSVDLLIVDMLMEPGMDGLETYKKVMEIRPGQKTLIATGFSETSQVKEALSLGVGGYLKKPYLLDEIGSAVRSELDRNSQSRGESPSRWN